MKTADRAAATARSADCPISGCPVGARSFGGRGMLLASAPDLYHSKISGCLYETLPRWGLGAPCCPFILDTGMPWNFMVIKEKDGTFRYSTQRNPTGTLQNKVKNALIYLYVVRTYMEQADIHAKISALHSITVLPIKFHLIFAKGLMLHICNENLAISGPTSAQLARKRPCEAMNTPNHGPVIRPRSVCEQGVIQIPSSSIRHLHRKNVP